MGLFSQSAWPKKNQEYHLQRMKMYSVLQLFLDEYIRLFLIVQVGLILNLERVNEALWWILWLLQSIERTTSIHSTNDRLLLSFCQIFLSDANFRKLSDTISLHFQSNIIHLYSWCTVKDFCKPSFHGRAHLYQLIQKHRYNTTLIIYSYEKRPVKYVLTEKKMSKLFPYI